MLHYNVDMPISILAHLPYILKHIPNVHAPISWFENGLLKIWLWLIFLLTARLNHLYSLG